MERPAATRRRLRDVAVALLLVTGAAVWSCHIDDVALDARPCPCVDASWTCIAGRCVQGNGTCEYAAGGDPCRVLAPLHASPVAAVDGYGIEYCGAPALAFDLATGDGLNPTPLPPAVKSHAVVIATWTPDAFHLYAEVTQATVDPVPESPEAGYQAGDAFELYVSGFAPEGGAFGGVGQDSGATHVIAVPPPTSLAATYVGVNHTPQRRLTPDEFATRRTATGYTVEFALPWSTLTPAAQARPFAAGDIVGLDFGLDVLGPDASGTVQRYQSFLHVGPGDAGDAAANLCGAKTRFVPYCDDRSWCTPRLGT